MALVLLEAKKAPIEGLKGEEQLSYLKHESSGAPGTFQSVGSFTSTSCVGHFNTGGGGAFNERRQRVRCCENTTFLMTTKSVQSRESSQRP